MTKTAAPMYAIFQTHRATAYMPEEIYREYADLTKSFGRVTLTTDLPSHAVCWTELELTNLPDRVTAEEIATGRKSQT
jgi:hypothetical protein